MPRLPKHFEHEDLQLSGPRVWPTLHAHDIPSRYIHGRPELTYLSARKKALARAEREGRDPAEVDRIRVAVVRKTKRDTPRGPVSGDKINGSFVHTKHQPLEKDVPELLEELYRYLCRTLPKDPDPYLTVQLRFSQNNRPRSECLGSYQARWW